MTRAVDLDGFERKFRANADPWGCRDDPAEALKRRRTLAHVPGPVSTALDVGCGDGATTRALARRALTVDAVDGAPAALASAGAWCADAGNVRFHRARLPDALPRGSWRLILVSEVAYYLGPRAIERLAAALAVRLAPAGRLIAVNHLTAFDDTATPSLRAEALFLRALHHRLRARSRQRWGHYAIATFDRPRRPLSMRNSPASGRLANLRNLGRSRAFRPVRST